MTTVERHFGTLKGCFGGAVVPKEGQATHLDIFRDATHTATGVELNLNVSGAGTSSWLNLPAQTFAVTATDLKFKGEWILDAVNSTTYTLNLTDPGDQAYSGDFGQLSGGAATICTIHYGVTAAPAP